MPHPVDVFVGGRVRTLRVVRGVSQTELAEKIGNSFQQLQKYETGSNRISASKLYCIAKVLDVQPNYFFEGLEDGKSDAVENALSLKAVRVGGFYENIHGREIKESLYGLIKAVAAADQSAG